MDSQLQREGRLILLVDKQWKEDIKVIPHEEIAVPVMQLPDPEPDNGNPSETLKDLELKWNDLALKEKIEFTCFDITSKIVMKIN